ncbi:MAG: phenylalanine--tRNA ligase subunit alpha [Actinomycetia bacterium]|nr:phenylalanine--tRNA ligase subunit alpha [Actinomycetes bacterium]
MENLAALMKEAPDLVEGTTSVKGLDALQNDLLGRRSLIAGLQRQIGKMPAGERPRIGRAIQEARRVFADLIATRREHLERETERMTLAADRVDVTLPALEFPEGYTHLITSTIEEVCDIFIGLGYRVVGGPEAESGIYNFDALNTPPTHPSRLESDTLYLDWGDPDDEILLRTHTSPMQARYMEQHDPPAYVVVPGKVFRADTPDATHSPVFHQIEGLAVDENLTFSDLRGTLAYFAREFFGADRRIRMMPDYFPFTEPSAQMHASCFSCEGGGYCRVCGGVGWIELLGCGMVDPNVFEWVGYDPSRVSGFAFGMGVERIAQVRHGVSPLRHFFDNDHRVLSQFR